MRREAGSGAGQAVPQGATGRPVSPLSLPSQRPRRLSVNKGVSLVPHHLAPMLRRRR